MPRGRTDRTRGDVPAAIDRLDRAEPIADCQPCRSLGAIESAEDDIQHYTRQGFDDLAQLLYRLFVRLDPDPPGLPHNAIVVIDGDAKRNETAFAADFYADRREQWEVYPRTDPRSVE